MSDWDYERWQIRDRIDELEQDLGNTDDDWREHRTGLDDQDEEDDAWIDSLFDTLND